MRHCSADKLDILQGESLSHRSPVKQFGLSLSYITNGKEVRGIRRNIVVDAFIGKTLE